MRKIILILIFAISTGCSFSYDYDRWYVGTVTITSQNVFSVDGELYLYTEEYIPVEIYNPNNYTITVTADGIDYIIAPLATLELKEEERMTDRVKSTLGRWSTALGIIVTLVGFVAYMTRALDS